MMPLLEAFVCTLVVYVSLIRDRLAAACAAAVDLLRASGAAALARLFSSPLRCIRDCAAAVAAADEERCGL